MAFTFLVFGTCASGETGIDCACQRSPTTCIASTFSPPTRANSERGSSKSCAAPIFCVLAYPLLCEDVQPRFRWTRGWAPAGVERQACHLRKDLKSSSPQKTPRADPKPRHVAAVHPSTGNPGRVVDGHGAIVHERSNGGTEFSCQMQYRVISLLGECSASNSCAPDKTTGLYPPYVMVPQPASSSDRLHMGERGTQPPYFIIATARQVHK